MNRKNIFLAVLLLVFYFFLPVYLTLHGNKHQYLLLSAFYLGNAVFLITYLSGSSIKIRKLRLAAEGVEERINVQSDLNIREAGTRSSLEEKINRYAGLKKIIEDLNSSLTPEAICEQLAHIVFTMIASGKGTCVLYLVDNQTHALSLYKTKKEDRKVVIKAKQGDIFDHWVLRHASPLLIGDLGSDFRFDLETVKNEDFRGISSLISSPLISGNNFLGLLRLDDVKANAYSQEDLRFLATLCDLGAVALENGFLYQNTQELAIHDGLTGLFTKGHFMEFLRIETRSSIRHQRPFSLLMLDIDFFKRYNDKFGHIAGDIVLRTLSAEMSELVKERLGSVSRFGGEEFCIILPGQDKKAAMETADLIRRKIESLLIILRRQETKVTVSIGAASFPKDAADETELIMKADKAMYAAKAAGRNCVVGVK